MSARQNADSTYIIKQTFQLARYLLFYLDNVGDQIRELLVELDLFLVVLDLFLGRVLLMR